MMIGVPKEIKDHEYRVSVTPEGCERSSMPGTSVVVEPSAGVGSGYSDEEYRKAGGNIADSKEEVFHAAVAYRESQRTALSECPLFRPGQTLFTYLHLPSSS